MSGPTGTVTFLFTDIEGSTRLWEDRPEAMRNALTRHDEVLRAAIEGRDGFVFATGGDGFAAAFGRVADAVSAAAEAQMALAGADWPDGLVLPVRMGLHTGQATERAGDYFGPDVNRAARVMAVAHGGQIVCTAVVGELAGDDFSLRDLGEHRLRDLQSALRLFQVNVPGLEGVFPPLRSLDAYRSNLPHELSSFVGREDELRAVAERVRTSQVVSIVGVGGVGKTRLALHVGAELLPHYPDGVWLCELAPVLEPASIPDAVAASVGYTPPQGVAVADGLPRFLERKDLLLILDNCEHLVGAVAAFVTSTTTLAAKVSVLATSREALGISGEHTLPLPSLGVPAADDPGSVLASEAGALFVARATEARGGLVVDGATAAAVRRLCERLDGIALAIELAAAQTAMMSPEEILTRLDRKFQLLTGARRVALERHQTLRAAIDWSYDLLGEDERALCDRLSVCVAGFDLDAAAAMAAGSGVDEFTAVELLGSLVAKSLVEHNERGGVTRYRQLEMIRQYAAENLNASGTGPAARDDHARHYQGVATALFGDLAGPGDYDALERLETETANIAAAGRWLLGADRLGELLGFLDRLPAVDGSVLPVTTLDELGGISGEAIDRPDAASVPGFARACFQASLRAIYSSDLGALRHCADLAGHASDIDTAPEPLVARSIVAIVDGDFPAAASLLRRAVARAREGDDPWALCGSLALLATVETMVDPDEAVPLADEALAVARRCGGATIRLYPLQAIAVSREKSDPIRALDAADECARIDRTRRQTWTMQSSAAAGRIRVRQGELATGLATSRNIFRRLIDDGERVHASIVLAGLAAALAPTEPVLAVEFAAIAESDSIAPFPTFTTQPEFMCLADDLATAISEARAQAATLSYDDAVALVLDKIDRIVSEAGPSASEAS